MAKWCAHFVNGRALFFSKSEWPMSTNAQKADWAISQGFVVAACKSWVGFHSQPCVSDAHDAVVVGGVIEATRAPLAAQTAHCESASSSGTTGVQQPAPDTSRLHVVIDGISGYALADNGALQQGDSPEATRHEPPEANIRSATAPSNALF